jgi:SPP1 gp7 family putative phage head morphogenesis protein
MKTPDYWSKRFEMLNEAQLHKGEAYVKRTNDEYEKALAKIKKDTDAWYQRLAKNNDVSIAGARKLLKANELKEFKWDVQEYIKAGRENAIDQRWIKQLENASAKAHISRLEAQQLQIRQHIETLAASRQVGTKELLGGIYKDNYYKSIFELQKGMGLGSSFAKLDDRQLEMLLSRPWAPDGAIFSSRIWKDKVKLLNELNTTLVQSLVRGDPSDQMIKAFAQRMGISMRDARRLVMTEAAFFSGASRRAGYEELGVEKYQNMATLDRKTSDKCRIMDLTIFFVSEAQAGLNCAPFHAHCRTVDIPHYEGNITERAARSDDGKTYNVPGDMNYNEWAKEHAPDVLKPYKVDFPIQDSFDPDVLPVLPEKWYDETGKTMPKLANLKDIDLDKLLPDVPHKLGNIDVADTKAITLYIDKTEKAIRKATEEHAVAITPKGEVLHIKGDKATVSIEKLGPLNLKGDIITHNHPTSSGEPGGSFSKEDIFAFFAFGLQELRAVDSEHTHIMKKAGDVDLTPSEVGLLIQQAKENYRGKLTIEDLLNGYDEKHLTMVELAALIEALIYERSRHDAFED